MANSKQLSRQEEKVLGFARQGLGDKQIAAELGLSTDTVRTYWQRIRQKVGAGTRAEIVATLGDKQTKEALRAIETEKDTLVQEILKRKSIERRLRASEHQFRLLAEAMPQIVFAADASAKAVYFNQQFYDYTGLSPEKALGGGWMRTIHREDVEAVSRELKVDSILAGSAEVQIRIRGRRGEYRWHMCRSVPVRDDRGKISQWFGTATDIHDEVLLRQSLEDQTQSLQQAQLLARLGQYEYDVETQAGIMSDVLLRLLEFDDKTSPVNLSTYLEIIHPDDAENVLGAVRHTAETGEKLDLIYRIRPKSGRLLWVRSLAKLVVKPDGSRVIRGTLQDVTEAHQHAEALAAKQAALAEAEKIAKLGSFTWNIEEQIFIWSDNLLVLFGKKPGDKPMMWDEFASVLNPIHIPEYQERLGDCLQRGVPFDMEYELLLESGPKWIHALATPEFRDGKAIRLVGTCQDVTDRVRDRIELSRQAAHLEFAEVATETGSFIADYGSGKIEWSKNMFRLIGRDPEDGPLWASELCQYIHPDDREELMEGIARLRRGDGGFDGVFRFPRADGEERLIQICALPHFSGGKVDYSHGYLRDVTTAKRNEFRLKMSEQQFRSICENAPVAIFLSDTDGRCIFANKKYLEISGRALSELLDYGWVDFIHPDDREHAVEAWREAQTKSSPAMGVFRGLRPDGRIVLGRVGAYAIEIDEQRQGYVGVIEDLSETVQREAELKRLTTIVEATPDFIGIASPDGGLIYLNESAKRRFGALVGSPLGNSTIFDVVHESEHSDFREIVLPTVLSNGHWSGETTLLDADGLEIPVWVTVVAHRDADGRVEYISAIAHDVSQLLLLQTQLSSMTTPTS